MAVTGNIKNGITEFGASAEPAAGGSATVALLSDLRTLIACAKSAAALAVNMGLTMMYWHVGKRIRDEVLQTVRADYGEQIVATLPRQFVLEHGRGSTEKNLRRTIQFAEAFPDGQIVATLWRHLSWSHFRELLPLKRPLQREFYAEMASNSVRLGHTVRWWTPSCAMAA